MWLDVGPLVTFMDARRFVRARLGDSDRRTFERSIVRGRITEPFADRLCVKYLSIQPELIWPELTAVYDADF